MSWVAIIFIAVLLVILWFLFGNKQKDTATPASAAPSRSPAPTPGQADDLKVIEGVGPKIAGILNEAGVSTFAEMAQKSGEELRKILDAGGIGAIADPTTWPEQAALAAQGKMEALKELQERLQGGRKA
jgi:predicted flap endonuclease-1-like 5' DNA nuclease